MIADWFTVWLLVLSAFVIGSLVTKWVYIRREKNFKDQLGWLSKYCKAQEDHLDGTRDCLAWEKEKRQAIEEKLAEIEKKNRCMYCSQNIIKSKPRPHAQEVILGNNESYGMVSLICPN